MASPVIRSNRSWLVSAFERYSDYSERANQERARRRLGRAANGHYRASANASKRAGSEARSLEVGADLSSSSCDASTCVANSASASSHAPHPGCRLTRSARAPTRSSSTTEGRCCASNARGAEASTARAWRWWTETRAWCRPTPGRRPRRLPLRAARTPAASGVLRGHARGGDRREARGVREKGGQAAGGHGVQGSRARAGGPA